MPKQTQEQALSTIRTELDATISRLACASQVFEADTDDDNLRVRAENVVRECVLSLERIDATLDRFSIDYPTAGQRRARLRAVVASRPVAPVLQAVQ